MDRHRAAHNPIFSAATVTFLALALMVPNMIAVVGLGRENSCQGGTLSTKYAAARIQDGDDFLVVITHPDKIAPGPFQGIDIAKDPSC